MQEDDLAGHSLSTPEGGIWWQLEGKSRLQGEWSAGQVALQGPIAVAAWRPPAATSSAPTLLTTGALMCGKCSSAAWLQ